MNKLLLTMVALVVCCANDPIPSPTIPGYPCGYEGISCGHHMCCPLENECGPSPSCPAGSCCYEGSHGGGFEKRSPTKQTPESGR